jgi:hypothetical protein
LTPDEQTSVTVPGVTVLETVVVYALIPLAILGGLALMTLWPKSVWGPRYRPGQPWEHPPVWWTANPKDVGRPPAAGGETSATAERGGAHGDW